MKKYTLSSEDREFLRPLADQMKVAASCQAYIKTYMANVVAKKLGLAPGEEFSFDLDKGEIMVNDIKIASTIPQAIKDRTDKILPSWKPNES